MATIEARPRTITTANRSQSTANGSNGTPRRRTPIARVITAPIAPTAIRAVPRPIRTTLKSLGLTYTYLSIR